MLPSAPRIIPKSTTTNRKLQGPIQEDSNRVLAFRHIMILNLDTNELRGAIIHELLPLDSNVRAKLTILLKIKKFSKSFLSHITVGFSYRTTQD